MLMKHLPYSNSFVLIALMSATLLRAGLAFGQANVQGQWSTLPNLMSINPIHAALLPNGKILIVAGSGNCPPSQSGCPSGAPYGPSNSSGAGLYDPASATFTQFTVSWDMFCNGMVHLPDGHVLIDGGTIQYDPFHGELKTAIFDPSTNTFTNVQSMAHGRWYPTVTALGNGQIMTFSGSDENGNTNDTVEIYDVNLGWSQQYPANWTPPLYPRMHVLPSGKVFYSGSGTSSALFDPSTDTWTQNVANTNYSGTRTYGTSLLLPLSPTNGYDPRIMIMGGNSPATKTTEIIDMGASSPKWVYGPNMSQPRIEMNAVILPNGKILAMGGSTNDEDTSTLSLNADLYDPTANAFSSAGANASQRLYHSVALLLPDATVWLAGGNPSRGTYNNTMEIYRPAYLFNSTGGAATRPSITNVPASISYGNQFTVQTPDAANISSVVLMRNGAVTHAFDMDQRMVQVSFGVGSGSLTVTAPPNGNVAPPGYYMLFLLNSSGVPSVASFVQLGQQPTAATPSFSPNPGTFTSSLSVTLSDTTPGATIYYTTDGTVPTLSSSVYTSPIPVKTTTTINAIAAASGLNNSTMASGVYTISMGAPPPPGFIQGNAGPSTLQSSNSSVAVAYPAVQVAGHLNVVAVGWGDTTSTISSVTDTQNNTYTLAIGPTSYNGLRQSVYYAKNIAGGSNTVTVKFNQSASYPDVRILEYAGADPNNPLDQKAAGTGTGTSTNSTSVTTTSANELIFGTGTTGDAFSAAGSGFVNRMIDAFGNIAEDKTVTSTGSYNATATTGSAPWIMQVVTFK